MFFLLLFFCHLRFGTGPIISRTTRKHETRTERKKERALHAQERGETGERKTEGGQLFLIFCLFLPFPLVSMSILSLSYIYIYTGFVHASLLVTFLFFLRPPFLLLQSPCFVLAVIHAH